MNLDEKMNEYFKRGEFCAKCGSKDFEISKNSEKKIICNSCKFMHSYSERINLEELRIKIIKKLIES
jgi:hypothetical protein